MLNSQEYQDWLAAVEPVLFCPGIPGAGKTFLTSIVVNDLQERYRNDSDVGIVYLYCSYKRQAGQKLDAFVASLIRQLIQDRQDLLTEVSPLYREHKRKGTRPSSEVGLLSIAIA